MTLENKTYDEIQIGDSVSATRLVTANDLILFAHASGNINPLHLPKDLQDEDDNPRDPVAPSMWGGSLFSMILGNRLPGPGTLYRSQSLTFHGRARLGDTLVISVEVIAKKADRLVELACRLTRQGGDVIAEGIAEVYAPAEKHIYHDQELPDLIMARHVHFNRMLAACKHIDPLPTAIVCPEDDASLGGAMLAIEEGLIAPIFFGDPEKIQVCADEIKADISDIEIIAHTSHRAAAKAAVQAVHEGRVRAIMKGHLHSDDLLGEITKKDGGLRTNRRISHDFVMDIPGREGLLHVTDAAINIAPSLEAKVDIVQNAIDMALALGAEQPRVGILSAVEVVNPKIPSTLDAAILSKMADRGQIKGGIVDGPLAMDNAISASAAKTKGITSLVAGHAEVLVAPNLESGNMLAKELTFVAHADAAGIVLGAQVPIMLTSRADNEMARLASCALALLYQYWKEQGMSFLQTETGKAIIAGDA